MTLSWKIATEPEHLTCVLSGAMTFHDHATGDQLLEALFTGIGSRRRIVFDLGAVTMIDSHWLGMFVRALKRAEDRQVKLVLRGAQPTVRRLLDLVQFDRVFQVEP